MTSTAPPRLYTFLPDDPTEDALLAGFLAWVEARGLTLYPAQEEAILDLLADKHVILATPTGSGKSLVALFAHFRAIALGLRAFYTSPVKALVSEKFFDLCQELGAERVGLMTGDATVHNSAPVLCCTAEVLAQMALQDGEMTMADVVVMDEFHYYADRDRGMAWQVPLLALKDARFLLMSATLGDTTAIEQHLKARTGRAVTAVTSVHRPVPLSFDYRETPLHETLSDLLGSGRAPVYLVHFSQREAAEAAQDLMSIDVCSKTEKQAIAAALQGEKWPSPYGKDLQRLIRHGIGLHHAGLLPRYRMLVERLAQTGLLKVICGTDTLGVGINMPLKTVVLTRLCKFDGEGSRLLGVREFQQIAGRAGRKGFDVEGWVVVQAPEHVIANKRMEAKIDKNGKTRSFVRQKPPDRGYVPWDKTTFDRLVTGKAEPLQSVFRVDHGMLMTMLHRSEGLRSLVGLIGRSHERAAVQLSLRRDVAHKFRALFKAGVALVVPRESGRGSEAKVAPGLQRDFSLHHTLSLYVVDAIADLDPDDELYPLRVITLVESILENPAPVLMRQVAAEKTRLINEWKMDGVPYEERMERLQEITWPKPDANWIYAKFEDFTAKHPWVAQEVIRPKSVAREMVENLATFDDYVRDYNLQPMEGVLLRYLTQVYKALVQNVPAEFKTDAVHEAIGALRGIVAGVDRSLLEEWERMRGLGVAGIEGALELLAGHGEPPPPHLDRREQKARLRTALHGVMQALAAHDWPRAAEGLRAADWDEPWPPERLEGIVSEFEQEHGMLRFGHEQRLAQKTTAREVTPGTWRAATALVGLEADEESGWRLELEAVGDADPVVVWLGKD